MNAREIMPEVCKVCTVQKCVYTAVDHDRCHKFRVLASLLGETT